MIKPIIRKKMDDNNLNNGLDDLLNMFKKMMEGQDLDAIPGISEEQKEQLKMFLEDFDEMKDEMKVEIYKLDPFSKQMMEMVLGQLKNFSGNPQPTVDLPTAQTEPPVNKEKQLTDIPLAGEWKFKAFPAEPRPVDPSSPSSWDIAACHNGMVAPLFGMAAKGAIWYQGCSDVGNADLYAKQFPAMVGAWRKGFVHDDAGFPVYLVQLAAFKETHAEPIDSAWARMRWTQMRLGETVPPCGTAVAIDVGDHRDIHPKDKKTVGERLARLALARTYGREGLPLSPIPVRASYDWASGHTTIEFIDPVSRKPANLHGDLDLRGFQVSVDGGDWKWAEQSFVNEKMFPSAVFVDNGGGVHTNVCIRYAWDDYPDCSLVSADGLPVGPFELKATILDVK